MNDYLLLMHDDAPPGREAPEAWPDYFARLHRADAFAGGSSIGDGLCMAKSQPAPAITRHLTGYIRIRAADLASAQALVAGNPVFEAGGTVEIRELPRD